MISLTIYKPGVVKVDMPYDKNVISSLKKIPGHRWNPTKSMWTIPLEFVSQLYDLEDASMIMASPEIMAELKKNTGGFIQMWRIRPGVIEIGYSYEPDIDDAVKRLICRYKTSVNHWLITDEETKHLIHQLGYERFVAHKTVSPDYENVELNPGDGYNPVAPEKIVLNYSDPMCTFEATYAYSKALRNRMPEITWDRIRRLNVIPICEVPKLIALVGADTVDISDAAEERIKFLFAEPVPVKERLLNIKPCCDFKFKTNPYPHQIEAFNFGLDHSRILIADECGCGKTIESLTIAIARKQYDGVKKALIICGVNSVKYNWLEEIKSHTNEKGIVIDGATRTKKEKQITEWLSDPDIYFGIINIEALRTKKPSKKSDTEDEVNPITEMLKGSVGLIIADEIHKAKNSSSQQGRALQSLKAEYEIGLSGTPMTNKPEDLYGILSWLGIERRSYWNFIKAYCVKGGFKDKEIIGYKNQDDLSLMLKTVMIRRRKDEILDLPDKSYLTEYLTMDKAQSVHYADAENDILQILDKILSSNNPLTHLLRLKQVTSGIFETADKDDVKLQRITDYIENEFVPNGQKALIFSQFGKAAEKYRKALSKYNPAYITGSIDPETRQKEVERFQNDPNCPIAIGTIGAMGTGLNMTAASYVIFVDKAWTDADNKQAEDRAHRIGTNHNVTIITLCVKDSIDERIEKMLKSKARLFDDIVNGKAVPAESKKEMVLSLLGK